MEFEDVVRRRRSVREFSNKRVSWRLVLEAIDDALQGPFAGNHDNFKFLIIEDSDKIKEIAELCEQEWIANSSILVVVGSDDVHLENVYGERGRVYSRQQAGALIQTMLLRLTDLGLGSCWVGAYDDEKLRKKLNMAKHMQIEAILPIGYVALGKSKKPRKKELENAIYWEEWGQNRRPSIFEEGKLDLAEKK